MDFGIYFDDDEAQDAAELTSVTAEPLKPVLAEPAALTALIYDRNPNIAQLCAKTFEKQGFASVTVAENPDAIKTGQGFDLYFIDVEDQIEAWAQHVRGVRRLFVSADPFCHYFFSGPPLSKSSATRVVESGCDTYFTRPFTTDMLVSTLNRFKASERGYVVAPKYIGPDRRVTDRTQIGPLPLQAPHPLGIKRAPNFSSERFNQAHRFALAILKARLIARKCDLLIPVLNQYDTSATQHVGAQKLFEQEIYDPLDGPSQLHTMKDALSAMAELAHSLSTQPLSHAVSENLKIRLSHFADQLLNYVAYPTYLQKLELENTRNEALQISSFLLQNYESFMSSA